MLLRSRHSLKTAKWSTTRNDIIDSRRIVNEEFFADDFILEDDTHCLLCFVCIQSARVNFKMLTVSFRNIRQCQIMPFLVSFIKDGHRQGTREKVRLLPATATLFDSPSGNS